MIDGFPNIEKLLEEIQRLQRGYELFDKLVSHIGFYNLPHTETYGGRYPDLAYEIHDFFGFDDSE